MIGGGRGEEVKCWREVERKRIWGEENARCASKRSCPRISGKDHIMRLEVEMNANSV